MNEKIDFVVTWLDPSDPKWQADYVKYKSATTGRTESARFRDWGLFKYWFRSIEQYAPWVNKVFLVTNGKFPDWINSNHPKLVLVKHSDYIPEQFLPTFNSCAIEMFLHRIPGLSEHFVYFNDDCYLNAPVKPEYYFKKGLPCDCNQETMFNVPIYSKEDKFGTNISLFIDIGVINANFARYLTVRKSMKRWYGLHLGIKGICQSLIMGRKYKFVGFTWRHWEMPFLKSTFDEVWKSVPELLEKSCTRFREEVTLNPYIFRYWQFASNKFYPSKLNKGKCIELINRNAGNIKAALFDTSILSLCLNDIPSCPEDDYLKIRQNVQNLLFMKFPDKCTYEK